jgi:hypothetical protein
MLNNSDNTACDHGCIPKVGRRVVKKRCQCSPECEALIDKSCYMYGHRAYGHPISTPNYSRKKEKLNHNDEKVESLCLEEEKKVNDEELERLRLEEEKKVNDEELERLRLEEEKKVNDEEVERLRLEEEKKVNDEEVERLRLEEEKRVNDEEVERLRLDEEKKVNDEEVERLRLEEEKKVNDEEVDRYHIEEEKEGSDGEDVIVVEPPSGDSLMEPELLGSLVTTKLARERAVTSCMVQHGEDHYIKVDIDHVEGVLTEAREPQLHVYRKMILNINNSNVNVILGDIFVRKQMLFIFMGAIVGRSDRKVQAHFALYCTTKKSISETFVGSASVVAKMTELGSISLEQYLQGQTERSKSSFTAKISAKMTSYKYLDESDVRRSCRQASWTADKTKLALMTQTQNCPVVSSSPPVSSDSKVVKKSRKTMAAVGVTPKRAVKKAVLPKPPPVPKHAKIPKAAVPRPQQSAPVTTVQVEPKVQPATVTENDKYASPSRHASTSIDKVSEKLLLIANNSHQQDIEKVCTRWRVYVNCAIRPLKTYIT